MIPLARSYKHPLELFEECIAFEDLFIAANILASFGRDVDQLADSILLKPSWGLFLTTLARVEISTLETDEVQCSICKAEYGTDRGEIDGAEPAD